MTAEPTALDADLKLAKEILAEIAATPPSMTHASRKGVCVAGAPRHARPVVCFRRKRGFIFMTLHKSAGGTLAPFRTVRLKGDLAARAAALIDR